MLNLFAWLRSRKEAARLVQADADSLIARFGDGDYFEARDRAQRSTVIDSDGPHGHWTRVKLESAKELTLRWTAMPGPPQCKLS